MGHWIRNQRKGKKTPKREKKTEHGPRTVVGFQAPMRGVLVGRPWFTTKRSIHGQLGEGNKTAREKTT